MKRALAAAAACLVIDLAYLVGWDAWNSDRNWFRPAVGLA